MRVQITKTKFIEVADFAAASKAVRDYVTKMVIKSTYCYGQVYDGATQVAQVTEHNGCVWAWPRPRFGTPSHKVEQPVYDPAHDPVLQEQRKREREELMISGARKTPPPLSTVIAALLGGLG